MTELRDILRTIQSQAAAGDPTTVQTVRVLADWLEEHGDARAMWVAGLASKRCERCHGLGQVNYPRFSEARRPDGFKPGWGTCDVCEGKGDNVRELARRVLAAMTRECPHTHNRWYFLGEGPTMCGACHGDGWIIAEAVACGKCGGHGTDRYVLHNWMTCPDCAGQSWRVKDHKEVQ